MTESDIPDNRSRLTSNRTLLRSIFYNFLGHGAPILVALFTVPMLIKHLGTDRFGVLTLSWMIIGYFSLFDFGLGRAMTKLVAEKLGAGLTEEIPGLFWASIYLMGLLGAVGTGLFFILAPWLVKDVLSIPELLQNETLHSLYVLAFSIPVVIITAGLKGFLEAYQRFGLVNIVRVPMGMLMYLGPLMVLPFSQSLLPVVTVLAGARLLALIVQGYLCLSVAPELRILTAVTKKSLKPLVSFGGWMTVTNIIGPLMVYLDRFMIGALVSITAVAHYCTPYEIVTKLWFIPGALVGVLFPAFTTSFTTDPKHTVFLFWRSVKYMFLILFPLILLLITFAYEGLDLWLGSEFSQNSTLVLQLLAVGVFINCLANIPYTLIQSIGRPDITAKLHLVELPFYLAGTWYFVKLYGIDGAAVVWLARVTIDALLLFAYAYHRLSLGLSALFRMSLAFCGAMLIVFVSSFHFSILIKMIFVSLELGGFALTAWFYFLTIEERSFVRGFGNAN